MKLILALDDKASIRDIVSVEKYPSLIDLIHRSWKLSVVPRSTFVVGNTVFQAQCLHRLIDLKIRSGEKQVRIAAGV
jgi:hypothetical protein